MHPTPILVLGNFLTQKPTGVQRYAIEMTRVLALDSRLKVTLVHPPGVSIPERLSHVRLQEAALWSNSKRRLPAWAFLEGPLYIRFKLKGYKIVWNPSNIGSPIVPNQVLTLHDISFIKHPSFFSRSFRAKHILACHLTLPKTLGVATVSKTVQAEIEQEFKYLQGRTGVAYNGVSELFHPVPPEKCATVLHRHGLKSGYLLSVGSIDPRKNNRFLIEAYVRSNVYHSHGIELVLVGGKFASFASDPTLESLLRSPGVKHLGYAADEDLPALYSSARSFVFPSVYEGFGIPIIEAAACGTKVICSDIPVFREVAPPETDFFDLKDEESLAALLRRSADTPPSPSNERLGEKSFSWQKGAKALADLLLSAAEKAKH